MGIINTSGKWMGVIITSPESKPIELWICKNDSLAQNEFGIDIGTIWALSFICSVTTCKSFNFS